MSRSFGIVDYKVQEAEHFLLELKRHSPGLNFGTIQFTVSAFVSAARSITFAMQASLKGNPKFEAWYRGQQESMRSDPLAKFFHDFRTVTQHLGINVVSAGASGRDGTFYYFVPCDDLKIVPKLDVLSACETYFKSVLSIVYDCYVELGAVVNGQQYFTQESFEAHGKTIEDAEAELGFPRGWTNIGKPEIEAHRWHVLRRHADGCLIEAQFERWLNKQLPKSKGSV